MIAPEPLPFDVPPCCLPHRQLVRLDPNRPGVGPCLGHDLFVAAPSGGSRDPSAGRRGRYGLVLARPRARGGRRDPAARDTVIPRVACDARRTSQQLHTPACSRSLPPNSRPQSHHVDHPEDAHRRRQRRDRRGRHPAPRRHPPKGHFRVLHHPKPPTKPTPAPPGERIERTSLRGGRVERFSPSDFLESVVTCYFQPAMGEGSSVAGLSAAQVGVVLDGSAAIIGPGGAPLPKRNAEPLVDAVACRNIHCRPLPPSPPLLPDSCLGRRRLSLGTGSLTWACPLLPEREQKRRTRYRAAAVAAVALLMCAAVVSRLDSKAPQANELLYAYPVRSCSSHPLLP